MQMKCLCHSFAEVKVLSIKVSDIETTAEHLVRSLHCAHSKQNWLSRQGGMLQG